VVGCLVHNVILLVEIFVVSESKLIAATTLLLIAKHGHSSAFDENCGLGKQGVWRVSIMQKKLRMWGLVSKKGHKRKALQKMQLLSLEPN
jgi:hypothetical protein